MLDITDPAIFVEAITAVQKLIERVQLVPENGELRIKLYDKLVALLKRSTEPKKNNHPLAESKKVQITMVAGARNRRYLHLDYTIIRRLNHNKEQACCQFT